MPFDKLNADDKKELRDVIDKMTAIQVDTTAKKELASGMGLPPVVLAQAVTIKVNNPSAPLVALIKRMRESVEQRLGSGAFNKSDVLELIDVLVMNQQDLRHYQKILNGFDVDNFIVNKLVEVRSRSPLDAGHGLLKEMIAIAGVSDDVQAEVPEDAESADGENKVAGATPALRKQRLKEAAESRKTLWEVALGIGLGMSAIALLV